MNVLKGVAILVVAGGVLLAACADGGAGGGGGTGRGASAVPAGGTRVKGGTVTWAELPGAAPDFIYPFMPARYDSVTDTGHFQYLMYRPLYWFGEGAQPVVNLPLSLADPPQHKHGTQELTIKLKRTRWSDGERVTATDVMQWLNMAHAEKSNWADYIAGLGIPDQVTSVRVDSPNKITIHLSVPVNLKWFTFDMLSQITPLPEAWDITHTGAAPGSGGCGSGTYGDPSTDSACRAVWNYMVGEAGYEHGSISPGALSTYATNPLWQVVDGPWHLSGFNPDGQATFVPNREYTGRNAPTISKFVEVPFTSQSAELEALNDRQLTVGYLPVTDAPRSTHRPRVAGSNTAQLNSSDYLLPAFAWSINYFAYNFNSTGDDGVAGKIFGQPYFRQAIQLLVDQPKIIKKVDMGYGIQTYLPVPLAPDTNPAVHNPYPYNPGKAITQLISHGWNITPHGVDTCIQPGSGSDQCGPGIPMGARLDFTLEYASSTDGAAQRMAIEDASWAAAGIKVTLLPASSGKVTEDATACRTGPTCTWELEDWGNGTTFTPDHYTSGQEIFSTSAPFNFGSYSSRVTDNLIDQLVYTNAIFLYYKQWVADELPVVFQDEPATYLLEIAKNLRGVAPFNVFENINPEHYYFVK